MCELIGAAVTGGYTIQPSHPRHESIIVNSNVSNSLINSAFMALLKKMLE